MLALIELGIGLTLVYLAGALVVTAAMEAIAGVLRMRAATLRQGLAGLLRNDSIEGKLLSHPLVATLTTARAASPAGKSAVGQGGPDWRARLPLMTWVGRAHEAASYIPSRSFALALLDVVSELPTATAGRGASERGGGVMAASAGPLGTGAKPEGEEATAPDPDPAPLATLQAVFQWAGENKGGSEIARALDTMRMEAGNDLSKLRSEIERWYDEAMDRVAGLYKRWTQWVGALVGLAVAALVNIDTIGIVGALRKEPAMRAELARLGDQLARDDITAAKYGEVFDALVARGMPLGWPEGVTWPGVVSGIPGWILTAFALSLGAAFWFDVLKRLVNVRSSGPKPESTVKTEGR